MDVFERLKVRTGDEDENLLKDLLESAKSAILGRRFPYQEWPDEVEPQYQDLQVRIAVNLYDKIGASGQTGHSENGINRQWASENISKDLLSEITPMCGVVR